MAGFRHLGAPAAGFRGRRRRHHRKHKVVPSSTRPGLAFTEFTHEAESASMVVVKWRRKVCQEKTEEKRDYFSGEKTMWPGVIPRARHWSR